MCILKVNYVQLHAFPAKNKCAYFLVWLKYAFVRIRLSGATIRYLKAIS